MNPQPPVSIWDKAKKIGAELAEQTASFDDSFLDKGPQTHLQ
ncbi:MAG: hypothetical protein V1777_00380 [Candidatus Micrarchaeota archaeon]